MYWPLRLICCRVSSKAQEANETAAEDEVGEIDVERELQEAAQAASSSTAKAAEKKIQGAAAEKAATAAEKPT